MADVTRSRRLEAPVEEERHHVPSRGYWADAWYRLLRSRAGQAGLVIVGLMAILAVLGPMIAPWDPRKQDLAAVTATSGRPIPPFTLPDHLLGTDNLGRDLLSRTIDGAQVSMTVALIAQVVVVLIGLPLGALAGWKGGRTEGLIMRFTDVMYAFPELLFIVLLTSAVVETEVFHWLNGLFIVFVAIGASAWVTMCRLVRAQVLSLKQREFVEAARAIGVPGHRIVLRHVLPNAIGPVVVAISLGLPAAVIAESTLSFLGLGVQVPRASWGSLIQTGAAQMDRFPWLVAPPLVALAVTLIGFTLLGDGLRDALDPRLRPR
jgi:ABC-type dipeptide/oligopeptide/nickel transport system permease subunit